MSLLTLLGLNALAIGLLMVAVWLASLARRDASIVDIVWGPGFVLVAWIGHALLPDVERTRWLVGLTTIWGMRLSFYLAWRNWGKPEDYRYRAMRDRHGDRFWWKSLIYVFGLQGVVMWIVSLPIQIGQWGADGGRMSFANYAGVFVCLTGIVCETLADFQLAQFKQHPENRGKVMDRGLWHYTRHPNYFGDFLVWWGIFLVAAGGGISYPTIVSPLLMSLLLIKVSGVALLEQNLRGRSVEYQQYIARTSPFIPWFPRKSA